MNRTSPLVLAFLLVGTTAWAQETGGVTAPPTRQSTVIKGKAPVAKELLRVRFPRPQEFRLPNGLRVFVLEDHRLPTVSIALSLKAGTLFETRSGVADLTAALLDEGTRTRTYQQIAEETERRAISLSATAGTELADISVGGLTENTDRLVDLLADVLLRPTFPADRLARVQFQMAQGLAQQRSDPAFLAAELSARVLYGDTPYARISPSVEEVQAVTRADLVAFHEKFYRPDSAILGVAGDVKAAEIAERLRSALAEWKPSGAEPVLPSATFSPQDAARVYLIDRPGSAQTILRFGNLGITRTDPDYIPLVVMNRILGGSFGARLNQNLREDKGYTYGANSSLSTPRWPGVLGAGASVRTPVTAPAVAEFVREFRRIQNEPVSGEELAAAKRSIIGAWARTLESPESLLGRALELAEYGLPADYWDTYPAKIEAVTAADIERVAKKYLGENRIQLIAVGERKEIEADLREFGPMAIYDTSGSRQTPVSEEEDNAGKEIARIRGGQHAALPRPVTSPVSRTSNQGLTIENHTGHVLKVYFAGSSSKTVTIPEGKEAELNLDAGEYELAAEIVDGRLLPFYGKQSFESGKRYRFRFSVGRN